MVRYSVLMSVYHKEKAEYFEAAMLSMLNQSCPPDEFVLVCDGPLTKELDEVIDRITGKYNDLFVVLRLEHNKGLGIALQQGLRKCTNEIVARMDSDDIAMPFRMQLQTEFLESNPHISVVGGQISEFCGKEDNIIGYRKVPLSCDDVKNTVADRCPMNHMTVTFRKSAVEAVGSYVDFKLLEDYHLWSRLIANGYNICNLDEVLVNARVDENMYKRRGGINYYRQIYALEKFLFKIGISSRVRCIKNIVLRFCAVVLVPNCLRSLFYNKLLRSKQK